MQSFIGPQKPGIGAYFALHSQRYRYIRSSESKQKRNERNFVTCILDLQWAEIFQLVYQNVIDQLVI